SDAFRSETGVVQTQWGPGADFGDALPAAFRDPLPLRMSAHLSGNADPVFVREVAYEDVRDWLAAPREWRRGFTERFRPRLRDPAFLHTLRAHLSAHPEWGP